ncbi:MAG: type III pantothenate kinase [Betaproteobacteria bacterium]
MKVLAIDAGNTRIKWGVADERRWLQLATLATAEAGALHEALAGIARPDCIVVSNVAGSAVGTHLEAVLAPLQASLHWVRGAAQQCGVRSSYADPAQLGPDRWAALIAARDLFSGPCVIVNAGTAMTVDALSGEGLFLGGFIVPGVKLMHAALASGTAHLKGGAGHFSYFPSNTADAIVSGGIHALAGAVERMARFMAHTGEGEALVVLSGGDAQVLASQLNARVEVVDNLVLEGLLCIACESG